MSHRNRYTQVGIDRPIRFGWLDQTAQLLLAKKTEDDVVSLMTEVLSREFPDADPSIRGSLSKTMTILMKTWIRVPKDLRSFRDRGLRLLASHGQGMKIPIHWGMLMSAYPFWGAVAHQSGRLLHLQGNVVASQLQRRLREQYGERETVSRRARYAMRSFVDWRVLAETGTKGTYRREGTILVTDKSLSCWLVESCLNMRESGTADMRELKKHHSLFPFQIPSLTEQDLRDTIPGLGINRHAIDETVVTLTTRHGIGGAAS